MDRYPDWHDDCGCWDDCACDCDPPVLGTEIGLAIVDCEGVSIEVEA